MKAISPEQLAFCASVDLESCYAWDLITITLQSGQVIYATDGQLAINYNGQRYLPSGYGNWTRKTTSHKLGVTQASMTFEVTADESVILPWWGIPVLQAIQLGLFDGAVIVVRAFQASTYGDCSMGGTIAYAGQITELPTQGRTLAEGTCEAFTFTLNQQMPHRLVQPECTNTVFDAGCALNPADWSEVAAVAAGSTQRVIVASLSKYAGYYTQGRIIFSTGRNAGLSMDVELHASGGLTLSKGMILPVAVGDTFTVEAGCDNTLKTCQQKFNNLANYIGEPYVPNYESAI